jgi:hypothetical protein
MAERFRVFDLRTEGYRWSGGRPVPSSRGRTLHRSMGAFWFLVNLWFKHCLDVVVHVFGFLLICGSNTAWMWWYMYALQGWV